eukprot:5231784-Pyramimonas_sp.AAC.1
MEWGGRLPRSSTGPSLAAAMTMGRHPAHLSTCQNAVEKEVHSRNAKIISHTRSEVRIRMPPTLRAAPGGHSAF